MEDSDIHMIYILYWDIHVNFTVLKVKTTNPKHDSMIQRIESQQYRMAVKQSKVTDYFGNMC